VTLEISYDVLRAATLRHVSAPLFITVSGAHLYGFPSPDSDFDLRGCHYGPIEEVLGLSRQHATLEPKLEVEGREVEIVSHEVEKYLRLMLRPNGYVLEQIYSPLVVHTTPEHEELKELARGCITRRLHFHYRGFAEGVRLQFLKEETKKIKRILYLYRVLMTGIHVLRTGELNANLLELNEHFKLERLPELIATKQLEWSLVPDESLRWDEIEFLRAELEQAHAESKLPEEMTGADKLSSFLVNLRRRQLRESSL